MRDVWLFVAGFIVGTSVWFPLWYSAERELRALKEQIRAGHKGNPLLCLWWLILLVIAGCSSPTAPTPPVAIVAPAPIVVVPPVVPRNPLLDDPRYDPTFYRQFAHNAYESPLSLAPLVRHTQAPRIYLMTVDDAGQPIDARTLDATAAALINVAGALTGHFGLEGLDRGTGTTETRPNRITVRWGAHPNGNICGRVDRVGGHLMMLYPKTPGCQCGSLWMRPQAVKHELGHLLGYWHTDAPTDLMYVSAPAGTCDRDPSPREMFHARVAYTMPIGSLP